jgi:hypothetical protein
MDGTHSPTKTPCSLSTRNQRYTENEKERPAVTIKSFAVVKLVMLYFLH